MDPSTLNEYVGQKKDETEDNSHYKQDDEILSCSP